ncbi:MAG: hypothetical protein IKP17_00420 [Oscillospiraceae bacterium]|jgi:hypothetical protein|nr:hypothetical protein [Oscillospiraceae bacterium]MBR4691202.1 hypothetical protein [Oscillospiraceae bacterium]
MKRAAVWLTVIVSVLCLAACTKRGSGVTTPGNFDTPTPYVPHMSADAADAGAEYAGQLCAYAWLDTYDMSYYLLAEDGSYRHFKDAALEESLGTGTWQLLKDSQGYMTLHMAPEGGKAFDLYDMELYDESIYARGLEDYAYIWLLCNPATE